MLWANSVAFAVFLSPVSASGEGNDFQGEVGSAVLRLGWGLQQREPCQVLVMFPAPSMGYRTGIAAGSKAASGGEQGCSCSVRVCGTGMEQAKAAEQGQQVRSRGNPAGNVQSVSEVAQG